MELLKNLFVRISGSFFSTAPDGLRTYSSKRLRRSLKLVSHNPNPISLASKGAGRWPHSTAGHSDVLEAAVTRSQQWLLSQQDPLEGYWVAELEADTTLTSEYLMLRRFLGLVDQKREECAVRYLRKSQLPDGGWPIYAEGPADISASVKAYFALKLAGVSPDEAFMVKARETILGLGGVVSANVFTKITLALFGQYDWRGIPSMPPEIILAPRGFYFNLYAVSYWSRAVLIPLLIVFSRRPQCPIPPEQGIRELFVVPPDQIRYRDEPPFKKDTTWLSWRNFFVWVDGVLKLYDRYPIASLRNKAIEVAEKWMLDHMTGDGGLGAIYPAMANSIFALRALEYAPDHALIVKALQEIEALEIWSVDEEIGETLHLQPCHSPIWDTALTVNALIEGGLSVQDPAFGLAGSWLRSRQTATEGDWKVSAPDAAPGGWYFQFENEHYPDVDDTAAVVMALAKLCAPDAVVRDPAIARGCQWALAMQSADGGWGAYDRNNNRLIFNKIPFADHQALLDPSTADLTGRCLEMLGTLGFDRAHPAVGPALAFIKREQEPDGSWYGRWGVNYIYGTWCVLAGLRAIGEDMSQPWVQKAVTWLESKQNLDGGWGESCESYTDKEQAGEGVSTPSQTAWALLALLSAGVSDSLSVVRGINYLLRGQLENGSWVEPFHTGTGFPRVFYLRYHGYAQYFPYWALSMYRNIRSQGLSRADVLRETVRKHRSVVSRS